MTAVGRERIWSHFSQTLGFPLSIVRLNYAKELRYGVLVDLARRVLAGEPIDLAMGNFNGIWQGDANAMALASLGYAATPPFVFNLAGPETLERAPCAASNSAGCSIGRCNSSVAKPADALLSNSQRGHAIVRLSARERGADDRMDRRLGCDAVAKSLEKPTHFETRDGRF